MWKLDEYGEKFWDKIDVKGADDCWNWKTANGYYGQYRGQRSHRIALAITVGRPLESTEFACHTCHNPSCCNPSHLYIGNPKTNAEDCVSKKANIPIKRRTKKRIKDKITTEIAKDVIVIKNVPKEFKQELKIWCCKNDVSMSGVVIEAIKKIISQ